MRVLCIDSRRTDGRLTYGEVYNAEIHSNSNHSLLVINGICYKKTRFLEMPKPLWDYSVKELEDAISEFEYELRRRPRSNPLRWIPCGEVFLGDE